MYTFSEAVTAMRAGRSVRRASWVDRRPAAIILSPSSVGFVTGDFAAMHFRLGDVVRHPPQFWAKQTARASGVSDPVYDVAPWSASADDVIACDWIVLPHPMDEVLA